MGVQDSDCQMAKNRTTASLKRTAPGSGEKPPLLRVSQTEAAMSSILLFTLLVSVHGYDFSPAIRAPGPVDPLLPIRHTHIDSLVLGNSSSSSLTRAQVGDPGCEVNCENTTCCPTGYTCDGLNCCPAGQDCSGLPSRQCADPNSILCWITCCGQGEVCQDGIECVPGSPGGGAPTTKTSPTKTTPTKTAATSTRSLSGTATIIPTSSLSPIFNTQSTSSTESTFTSESTFASADPAPITTAAAAVSPAPTSGKPSSGSKLSLAPFAWLFVVTTGTILMARAML
ncbi:hypothetical protein C8F01DRAFT_101447 [Mycena amicta]|nr:hypothetical protein C8F01DRAFT_101447 [Mycena amicta]